MTNNLTISQHLGAIILAGGKSSRMNFPKPWLPYSSSELFLEHIVNSYRQVGVDDLVVVINNEFCLDPWLQRVEKLSKHVTLIKNHNPEKGRLYSLKLGIRAMKKSFVLIHNVDNPFLDEQMYNGLISNLNMEGATVPSYLGKGGHPIVINSLIQNEITNTEEDCKSLREVLGKHSVTRVEVLTDTILTNLNTPLEYQKIVGEIV